LRLWNVLTVLRFAVHGRSGAARQVRFGIHGRAAAPDGSGATGEAPDGPALTCVVLDAAFRPRQHGSQGQEPPGSPLPAGARGDPGAASVTTSAGAGRPPAAPLVHSAAPPTARPWA
jgi:hypothetical protein